MGLIIVPLILILSIVLLDRLVPPPVRDLAVVSPVLTDRQGKVLHVALTPDQKWRLGVTRDQVDPLYMSMLLLREDRRFESHHGVDVLSVFRAMGQWMQYGRPVSGASTLSMQAIRLLEPRPRTIASKIIEMVRAFQLETRVGKDGVLAAWMTRAPFGGNLEGVRTASLAWFGKEPAVLSPAEAALLVAVPQDPNDRRPERFPHAARMARDRVIDLAQQEGLLTADEADEARATPVPVQRLPFPRDAAHVAQRIKSGQTTLDAQLQKKVQEQLALAAKRLPVPMNAAALVVRADTAQVLAWAGSASALDPTRYGSLDFTAAVRSPGSALKPFIYGMAFDRLVVHPETLVADKATDFEGYDPKNFHGNFRGEVTVAEALRQSLNVPAVAVLDRLGPSRFVAALQETGSPLVFPPAEEVASLPLALGGVGTTLQDLARLYVSIAGDGRVPDRLSLTPANPAPQWHALMQPSSAWYLRRILEKTTPPAGYGPAFLRSHPVAFKTGTSWGQRDAWAVGTDGRVVIAVWVGMPQGWPCFECTGVGVAAPLLFSIASLMPSAPAGIDPPPEGVLETRRTPLPPGLQRLETASVAAVRGPPAPRITFPASRAVLEWPDSGVFRLTARGGLRPLRWIADGQPLGVSEDGLPTEWRPAGPGFHTLVVVDNLGRSHTVKVRLREAEQF
ncbi:MAG: penicillin-binding protein 1C [Pseudomonadota bacterium]|nr:penicillin-binding protein 1C [Pseudomonadota bacterium]